MTDLDQLLDRVPSLRGTPRTVEELPGGLTNRNLKVTTPEGVFVARCNRSDTTLLGIDREAESFNTTAAERAGVGAPFIDFRPELGVLVIGFIDGRSYVNADMRVPGVLARVAHAYRTRHEGPRVQGDCDMCDRRDTYLRTCRDRGFAIPDDYEAYADDLARIRAALAVNPVPTVPCNNDLLPGNIVDDGERLWLIDYEYSGNNDPFFELGNSWTESELDEQHLVELVTAYMGREAPELVARARLWAVVSRYGWALWGYIQAAALDDDFDFEGWGRDRFDKAVTDFRSPHLQTWIDAVSA